MRRRRLVAGVMLAGTVAAGLLVHFLLAGPGGDVVGDVLYALAVYLFVVLLVPRLAPWWAAAVAAGWGLAVEVFQLTGIPAALAAVFRPVALVLGLGFDPRDLLVAVAVPAVAGAMEVLRDRRRARVSSR